MALLQAQTNQIQEQAAVNKSAAVLMGDLVNAGVVKQTGEGSFVAQGADGQEINFDYGQQ